jgi:hypothetical protein
MQKAILTSAFALALLVMGLASVAAANYKDPLDTRTLSAIKSYFSAFILVAKDWKIASEIILLVPPSPATKG